MNCNTVSTLQILQCMEMLLPITQRRITTHSHAKLHAYNAKGSYNIVVTDVAGKAIINRLQKDLTPSQLIRIEREVLPNGTYFLQLTDISSGEKKTTKIIFY